jgi:hypothetical protein
VDARYSAAQFQALGFPVNPPVGYVAGQGSGRWSYNLQDINGGTAGGRTQNLLPSDAGGFLHFTNALSQGLGQAAEWTPHGLTYAAANFDNKRWFWLDVQPQRTGVTGTPPFLSPTTITCTLSVAPNAGGNAGYINLYRFEDGTYNLAITIPVVGGSQGPYIFDLRAGGQNSGMFAIQLVGQIATGTGGVFTAGSTMSVLVQLDGSCDCWSQNYAGNPSFAVANAANFNSTRVCSSALDWTNLGAESDNEGMINYVNQQKQESYWEEWMNAGNPEPLGAGSTGYTRTQLVQDTIFGSPKCLYKTLKKGAYVTTKFRDMKELTLVTEFKPDYAETGELDYCYELVDTTEWAIVSAYTKNYSPATLLGTAADFFADVQTGFNFSTENQLFQPELSPYSFPEIQTAVREQQMLPTFGPDFDIFTFLQHVPTIALGVAGGLLGGPAGAAAGIATGKLVEVTAKDVFEGPSKKAKTTHKGKK